MNILNEVKALLVRTLQLGSRGMNLDRESALLGAIPELDSMAVVNIITSMEEHFGFYVEDDELSAETFETLGGLAAFVERKLEETT